MEVDLPPAPPLKREHEDKPESLVREKNVGTGQHLEDTSAALLCKAEDTLRLSSRRRKVLVQGLGLGGRMNHS